MGGQISWRVIFWPTSLGFVRFWDDKVYLWCAFSDFFKVNGPHTLTSEPNLIRKGVLLGFVRIFLIRNCWHASASAEMPLFIVFQFWCIWFTNVDYTPTQRDRFTEGQDPAELSEQCMGELGQWRIKSPYANDQRRYEGSQQTLIQN